MARNEVTGKIEKIQVSLDSQRKAEEALALHAPRPVYKSKVLPVVTCPHFDPEGDAEHDQYLANRARLYYLLMERRALDKPKPFLLQCIKPAASSSKTLL